MFDFIVFSQFQNKILENTTFDLKWLKGILKELYLLKLLYYSLKKQLPIFTSIQSTKYNIFIFN